VDSAPLNWVLISVRQPSEDRAMLCVTTRFRLTYPWQLPSMYLAYRRMRSDLEAAPGLLRHTFTIEHPLACYTLSVWESQEALERFANAHSHVRAVRHAKHICREIWSAYWHLDAVSAYASSWRGERGWPGLSPSAEQPWRLVPATHAARGDAGVQAVRG
jgi:heme-degrading monooxygenase HmoA